MQYGEAFARMGIPNMGRQGSGWCSHAPDGTLVLMAHLNYFHKDQDGWYYQVPDQRAPPSISAPAARSLGMLGSYFCRGRRIVLLVGEFITDGGWQSDGTWRPSKFKIATGWAYEATMNSFDESTGNLRCNNCVKFKLP